METSPQVDNDSVGAKIDTKGLRLSVAGYFPLVGELDSVLDTQSAVINIDATATGGRMRFIASSPEAQGTPVEIILRAEDKYGNLDRVFSSLGSNAAYNISFSADPAGITFNSSSMTQVSGWPGATPVARFKLGEDTISITSSLTGAITITANMTTEPPTDTTVTITFTGTEEWSRYNYSGPDTLIGLGETAVVMKAALKNLQASTDTILKITVTNLGSVRYFDIASVEVWVDTNGNGTFDTAVDMLYGSGTFDANETVAISGTDSYGAGDSKIIFIIVRLNSTVTQATTADTVDVMIADGGCSPVLSTSFPPPTAMNSPDSVRVRPQYLNELSILTVPILLLRLARPELSR